ncbi:MAG: DUF4012 domain-containing protein, partial [Actinomycetota bacterium]
MGLLALLGAARIGGAKAQLVRARAELTAAKEAMGTRQDAAAATALDRAAARLASAGRHARGFPLGLVRPIPLVGSPGRALTGAVAAGREGVAAGRALVAVLPQFPTSGAAGLDGHDLSAFHRAAVASGDALVQADRHLAAARRALAGPAGAMLPPVSGPARSMRQTVDDAHRQLEGARRGLALLADLTGPETEARVLLLAQDTMELRPTGGYIGSFGVLRFSKGTVALERYDSFEALPPPDPPMEAPDGLRVALARPWDLSNVGWWPDFPTSAAAAREMFGRQGGGEVDGVVAITEDVMAGLVGVLGPFSVPGYDEPVTGEGFADRVLYEVELKRPLDVPRKKFLTLLAQQLFDRLLALDGADLPQVVDSLDRSVGAGDVQMWWASPGRQRLVADTSWSGRLPRVEGDFLMLVDANLTASKANRDLVRTASYRVRRDDDGDLVARLEVLYRNEG